LIEGALLGGANPGETAPASPLDWAHGFVCRRVRMEPGARTPAFIRAEAEVVFVHSGMLEIEMGNERAVLGPGDVLTVPVNEVRRFRSDHGADLFVTRGGDWPSAALIVD
jgi:mannose-6-phosphate isomerase-like protein (cupin superfamily)